MSLLSVAACLHPAVPFHLPQYTVRPPRSCKDTELAAIVAGCDSDCLTNFCVILLPRTAEKEEAAETGGKLREETHPVNRKVPQDPERARGCSAAPTQGATTPQHSPEIALVPKILTPCVKHNAAIAWGGEGDRHTHVTGPTHSCF
jgi:hypothetical protein